MATSGANAVLNLYVLLLGRNADKAGFDHHVQLLESGASLLSIAQGIAASTEFSLRYSDRASEIEMVNNMFTAGLGRSISVKSELDGWFDYLEGATVAEAALLIAESPEMGRMTTVGDAPII